MWHDGEFERRLVTAEGPMALPGISQHPEGPAGASQVQPLPNTDIDSVIVCLKAQSTTRSLSILAPRLRPSSVVTLLQNGTGVYEELCETIWPNPSKRPQFILGTTTHGVSPSPTRLDGSVLHQSQPGTGSIKFGVIPDPLRRIDYEEWLWGEEVGTFPLLDPPPSPSLPLSELDPSIQPLRDTLTALLSLDRLNTGLLPLAHLQHEQLVKVALNSIINPLTAILGAGALPNGSLIKYKPGSDLMAQLATETSDAISAYLLAKYAPHEPPTDVMRLFSSRSLLNTAMQLVTKTRDNTSSMAIDVSRGRDTEIDYINGHIVTLGKKYGISTPSHQMVINMVRYTTKIGGGAGALDAPIVDRLTALKDKRERLQAIHEAAPEMYTRSRLELEQQKVITQQAGISARRLELDEGIRKRRREAKQMSRVQMRVIKSFFDRRGIDSPYPTPAEWRKMGWRDRARVLKLAINDVGGTEGWLSTFGKHATKEDLEKMLSDMEKRAARASVSSSLATAAFERSIGNESEPGSMAETNIPDATPLNSRLSESESTLHANAGEEPLHRLVGEGGRALSQEDQRAPAEESRSEPSSPGVDEVPDASPRQTPDRVTSPASTTESTTDPPVDLPEGRAQPSTDAAPSEPPRTSSTDDTPTFQSGVSSFSIDSLIASAPRQERTWDVPHAPPKARGPLPKKRTAPPPLDTSSPPSQLVPPGGHASLGPPGLPAARPTGRMANWMDGMITSAPRQERTWGVSHTSPTGRKDLGKGSISYRQGS